MPSTYSNLGIELIASGDQAGTWGTTTNTNLGTLIDQAISGYTTTACTGGTDTITIPNGATGVARNMFLELTGTGGGSLVVPTNKKLYFIYNNTSAAITVKVTTGVSVPAGAKTVLVCNGTDIVVAVNYLASLTVGGALGVTGATTLSSTLAVTGATALSSTLAVTGITTVAAGSAALPAIVSTTGTADTGLWFPAADTVAASTGGTERIRINSTGNLGIGLTSYSLPLSVVANSDGQNVQLNGRTGDSLGQMFFRNFGGTNNLASISSDSGNTLYFGTGSQTAPTVPTERMRIDSSGNVGIGTASPSTYGKLAVSVGNDSFMGATTSSGAGGGWQLNTYYLAVKTNYIDCELTVGTPASESSAMRFATIGSGTLAEAMRIDPSGQLILKRTAAVNSATLVCSAAQNTRAVSFVNNNNNNEVGYIFLNNDGTTTQYATTSDYRLKENVTPMRGALSVVAQLKPVTYKWKINGSDGQGFIAHELQAVVPDCVTGEKDGVEIYTDVDGNEQTIPKHQGIDTSFLVATLTAAIQELKAIIDTQATRIAALEVK